MKQKTLDYLESNKSQTPSSWREEAEWRQKNWYWLQHSQKLAATMLLRMKQLGLTQQALANQMNCSQQYISKILKGKENLSLETISKIEQALSIQIIKDDAKDLSSIAADKEEDYTPSYRQ